MSVRPSDYPPPFEPAEAVAGPTDPVDERIEVGVCIVGAGPAGLAAAIRLGQLMEEDPETAERLGEVPDIEGLRINRDGLWSEAVEAEAAGFPITMPEHLWDAARAEQELRTRKDPLRDRVGRLHEYLPGNADERGVYAVNDTEERVASRWIMDDVLQIPIKDQTPEFASRLRGAMEAEGWQYNDKTMRIGKRPGRGYKRAIPDFGI